MRRLNLIYVREYKLKQYVNLYYAMELSGKIYRNVLSALIEIEGGHHASN